MIVLIGPLLFALLIWLAIKLRRAGLSALETALMIVIGGICIALVMLGILMWGFKGFG